MAAEQISTSEQTDVVEGEEAATDADGIATVTEQPGDRAQIVYLPIEALRPAPDNPRGSGDYGDLKGFAATLKSQGVLQALTACTPDEDGIHMIVIGHRRYEAAKLAKLTTLPVCVRAFTEAQRIEAMAVENGQREDLTPLAEARTYQQLVGLGYSQRKLATRLGRSQAHISRRLALLELPEPAAQAVDAGTLNIEDAVELSKLAEAPSRMAEVLRSTARPAVG
jgi:ParB family chromosome partitioning protein